MPRLILDSGGGLLVIWFISHNLEQRSRRIVLLYALNRSKELSTTGAKTRYGLFLQIAIVVRQADDLCYETNHISLHLIDTIASSHQTKVKLHYAKVWLRHLNKLSCCCCKQLNKPGLLAQSSEYDANGSVLRGKSKTSNDLSPWIQMEKIMYKFF